MYQLPGPAIEAILKEWNPQEYHPLKTDIREWIRRVESLCETYGIPDTQRPQCAARFIEGGFRTELEIVLGDARTKFGHIRWPQFTEFMIAFDHNFQEAWKNLPFYKKQQILIGTALGVAGAGILAPVSKFGVLAGVGFTPAGVAAGSLAATVQSIVYGGATGGIFSLFQSAGATMALLPAGAIVTGAAITVAGIWIVKNGESITSEAISDSIGRIPGPGGAGGGNKGTDPPPYDQANLHGHLLTPHALQAIVRSWDISLYNPPRTDAADWLSKLRELCEVYGVPATQRTLCAMQHTRADCREAAHAAGCHNMTWDQFTAWLPKYRGKRAWLWGRKSKL